MGSVKTAQNQQLRSVEDAVGLRIRLMGPIAIVQDGRPVAIASRKARALIGYLTLRQGTEISRDVLTGLLWGERSEGQARASLRQTLSELRRALPASTRHSIVASKETISWAAGSAWIDISALETAAGSEDDDELRGAAELIRGELLEGLSVGEAGFEQWLTIERERIRLVACTIYTRLLERAEHGGRLEEALAYGLKLLSLDPLQEHIHRSLMRLYAAQGRHDAALAQYERCRRELSNQLGVRAESETEDLARSIRANRRNQPAKLQVSPSPAAEPDQGKWPALPDRPSVAVLPFTNLSGDPEQEYFADGMVEEIITALSRFRQLFVIARNSSFTYKGRAVDVKQVGRELGVRYVLEGSVRKAGSRVRIMGQLIDTSTGGHLWADRFEGGLEDIFDLQDQVTERVVGAIAPKLEEAEIERAKRKPTESQDAHDHFLRGMMGIHKWSREGSDEALSHFYQAIQLDPNYAAAYGMAARAYVQRNSGGWVKDRAYEVAETERLASRAVELGRDDAVALCTAGIALCDILGQIEDGDAMIDRALSLNPNLASAWLYSSWVKTYLGEPEVALERIAHALRLSPNDPQKVSFCAVTAMAQLFAGRFTDAYSSAEAAIRERPGTLLSNCIAAVSAALAGRTSDAQRIVARLLQVDPALRIPRVATLIPIRRPEDTAKWVDGLRKAGLPE